MNAPSRHPTRVSSREPCRRVPRRLASPLAFALTFGAAAADLPGGGVRAPEARRAAPSEGADVSREIDAAIARGLAFLVRTQNADGSWGSARRTKGLNIYAPVPGAHRAFRTGVTALCVSALAEVGTAGDSVFGGVEDAPGATAEGSSPEAPLAEGALRDARRRGEDWLLRHVPHLRRATPDAIYNVWGHAYAIEALAHLVRAGASPEREDVARRIIRGQIELLDRYESVDGGWGYYDFDVGAKQPAASPTCFTTATVLLAFDAARQVGIDAPRGLVDRALASIRRQRKADFSYIYGEYLRWQPMRPVNRPGGSLGRSQVANVATRRWGDTAVTDEVVRDWVERLLDRNLWLDIGRKRPVPHESWFEVAGYFYYYGHHYAAMAIEELPPEERAPLERRLARTLLPLQETDGSWWDYPLYDYHQPYGTAFALMALGRCRAEGGSGEGDAP